VILFVAADFTRGAGPWAGESAYAAPMRVALICPAPPGSRLGNRITALRWQGMLRELGHAPFLQEELGTKGYDLLVALHARRSAEAVRLSRERHPERPILVALTGTDLYRDIHDDESAQRSLALADRLIVLHPGGAEELPVRLRAKVRVVPQSVPRPARIPPHSTRSFEVAVVGHLRPEKDPLRTALAAQLLPSKSRIVVLHAGSALSDEMRRAAEAEQGNNARYRFLGELPRWRARALIARSRLLSLTSEMEGGANVLSEAIAAGTPVVASRIACTEAILGKDYPGLFPFGSTTRLARLLRRAEEEPRFLAELARRCRACRPLLSPARERSAWRSLLRELDIVRS
jgi:putative glycosyltransferase (TIGR04348 family)